MFSVMFASAFLPFLVVGGVNIDLHIAVEHGVNIATVCRSIIGEVRYHVERLTGVDVKNVDIYVESIKAD